MLPDRDHADLGTVGVLHGHIALAGTVIADQNGAEAHRDALASQSGHAVGHFGPGPCCHRFAVEQDRCHQCRKCRSPVTTMASPASSAAAITSPSFTEPPGWTTAVTPAAGQDEQTVGEGEERITRSRSPLRFLPGLAHGDLGCDHSGLLARTDPDRLPVGHDGDGVGRGAPADTPGQHQVAPFLLGRLALRHDAPVGPGRDIVIDVLHQHAGAQAPQLAHCVLGSRSRKQPGGLAPGRQLLQCRRLVGGGDDHVGLGTGGHRVSQRLGHHPSDGNDPSEGGLHITFECPFIGGDEVLGHGGAARVGVLDDGHRRLTGIIGELMYQPPCCVAVEKVEVRQFLPAVLFDDRPTSS